MTLVFVANGLAFGAWAGSIPRVREAAGLSDARLGLVLLCVALGAVLAMQVAGRFAGPPPGRIGLVRACGLGAVVLGAALALPGLVRGMAALMGSAGLLGFMMGWVDVCMNAHAAAMERRRGMAIMSSFHAGWSGGQLAGAALAGGVAGLGVGLVGSLAAAGALVAACGAGAVLLREGEAAAGGGRFAWPNRAMLALCALIGLSFAVEGAVADWSGVYLRTGLGVSAGQSSAGLAVFAGVMVLCRIGGDRLVRRLGARRVVLWGGALAAAGIVAAVLAPGLAWAAVAFGVVGAGVANVVPVVFSAAGRRGAAGVAMVSTAGYGTAMAAPALIGGVSEAVGLGMALLLVAAGAVGMAVLSRRVG